MSKEVTVKELREWLKQFDDDVIVKFVTVDEDRGYMGEKECAESDPVLTTNDWDGKAWSYTDFRNMKNVNDGWPYYNKQFLTLGEF